jgi:hypothetical protein
LLHTEDVKFTLLLFAVSPLAVWAQSIPVGARYWASEGRFIGAEKCGTCHRAEADKFRATTMARALVPVESCEILRGDIHFTFRKGSYRYSILREAGNVVYQVSNGSEVLSVPLEFAFGQGKAGQTYVYSLGGQFYESRVSYYAETQGLDLTVGAMNSQPEDLRSAAGRIMQGNEPRECFGCHTTGARVGGKLQLADYQTGVQCESCHGPGGDHASAVAAGRPVAGTIRALSKMDPETSNEFCGTCHRTWQTVMTMGIRGINTARFPSYRITNSPCFSLDDRRISCTTCHDPHGGLVTDDKYYDSKCTACHNVKEAKVCKVGKEACTSCHMQRVSPAEAHHAFPDHWFRIVRSAKDYPE